MNLINFISMIFSTDIIRIVSLMYVLRYTARLIKKKRNDKKIITWRIEYV